MIPVIQDLVMPGFQNPGGIIGDALKKIIGLKKAFINCIQHFAMAVTAPIKYGIAYNAR